MKMTLWPHTLLFRLIFNWQRWLVIQFFRMCPQDTSSRHLLEHVCASCIIPVLLKTHCFSLFFLYTRNRRFVSTMKARRDRNLFDWNALLLVVVVFSKRTITGTSRSTKYPASSSSSSPNSDWWYEGTSPGIYSWPPARSHGTKSIWRNLRINITCPET